MDSLRNESMRIALARHLVERLCERQGARIVSVDGAGNGDGPEAALMRSVIDAFAAYERALIRSRTKAALAVQKAKGERVGGIPYGMRLAADGRRLEGHPREKATTTRVLELRAEGESLLAIGRALLAEGRRPRNGKNWDAQVVQRSVARVTAIP